MEADTKRVSSTTVNGLLIHRLPIVVTFKPDESMLGVPLMLRASAIVDGVPASAELPLRWRPERQFTMSPQRAMLSPGDHESDPQPVSIILKRKDDRPFEIRDVRINSKLVSATVLPSNSDRQAAVEVRWTAKSPYPERFVATIVVMTDNPLEPRLLIPVVFVRPDAIAKN